MSVNIQTIKDIRPFLTRELSGIYPDTEIGAFANIITRKLVKTARMHISGLPKAHSLRSRQHRSSASAGS